jgi:hypothetical protein
LRPESVNLYRVQVLFLLEVEPLPAIYSGSQKGKFLGREGKIFFTLVSRALKKGQARRICFISI